MNRCLTLALLLVLVSCVFAQYPVRGKPKEKVPEVDNSCMNCLCQASSNCDESIKCHNTGGGGYFCGPYVISWAYWHDGGRPGDKGRAHDFESCLNNRTCAEQTVRGYMRKYGQDCDGNKVIDCNDFARIHKLGFSSCGGESIYNTDYWEKFEICHVGYPPNSNYNNENENGGFANYDYGDGAIQARNGQSG